MKIVVLDGKKLIERIIWNSFVRELLCSFCYMNIILLLLPLNFLFHFLSLAHLQPAKFFAWYTNDSSTEMRDGKSERKYRWEKFLREVLNLLTEIKSYYLFMSFSSRIRRNFNVQFLENFESYMCCVMGSDMGM